LWGGAHHPPSSFWTPAPENGCTFPWKLMHLDKSQNLTVISTPCRQVNRVVVWNDERGTLLTGVLDFTRERMSLSLAIYNGSIHFRMAQVLSKTSLA
jgi:hypothetical protein